MVSFTGSTDVGIRIAQSGAPTMKRLLLELGGKGACLVFDDADVAGAVGCIGSTWSFHSGQICTAPTRAVVQRGVFDQVVEGLSPLRLGPDRWATRPTRRRSSALVISAAHRDRVEGYIATG